MNRSNQNRNPPIIDSYADTIMLNRRNERDQAGAVKGAGAAMCDSVIRLAELLQQVRNPAKPLVFASKTAFGCIDIKKAWKEALKRAQIKGC